MKDIKRQKHFFCGEGFIERRLQSRWGLRNSNLHQGKYSIYISIGVTSEPAQSVAHALGLIMPGEMI